MNEEDTKKFQELFTSFLGAFSASQKTIEAPVHLDLDDFRAKKRRDNSKQKKKRLFQVFTSIPATDATFFTSILNNMLQINGFKWKISDLFRGVVDDFICRHTVESACEMLNNNKSKYLIK